MKILAVLPHFDPDVAPTGVIGTRLVEELGALGHHIEVVTSLPWYEHHDVLPEWRGKVVRRERTPWGRVTRVHPFPTGDKRSIPKRAVGFAAFCALDAGVAAVGGKVDVTFAMTPPLPMAATGGSPRWRDARHWYSTFKTSSPTSRSSSACSAVALSSRPPAHSSVGRTRAVQR